MLSFFHVYLMLLYNQNLKAHPDKPVFSVIFHPLNHLIHDCTVCAFTHHRLWLTLWSYKCKGSVGTDQICDSAMKKIIFCNATLVTYASRFCFKSYKGLGYNITYYSNFYTENCKLPTSNAAVIRRTRPFMEIPLLSV